MATSENAASEQALHPNSRERQLFENRMKSTPGSRLGLLSDTQSQVCLEKWRHRLGIRRRVRLERASPWQVSNGDGAPGCSLVGIYLDETRNEGVLVHTRRLSEEDIIHELLHVAYPDWSEAQVIAETARLLPYRHRKRVIARNPKERKTMPYSVKSNRNGVTYYLHRTLTKTPGGERTLHFFAKEIKEGAIDQVPEGYEVSESGTGLPVLKKRQKVGA